ncbi:MAG: HNH endonuclease [Methylosarcina sp.]
MWSKDPHEFALKHQITPGQARLLECTGDHLKAHRDAGSASQSNIAAACRFCNNNRHKRKEPPPPDQFKKLIKQRISQGRWHGLRLIE